MFTLFFFFSMYLRIRIKQKMYLGFAVLISGFLMMHFLLVYSVVILVCTLILLQLSHNFLY